MKAIFLIITMVTGSGFCFAQTDSTAIDSISAKIDSIPAKSTLTLAAVYSNNANYYGQRAEKNTPYAAVAANYQLKSGVYFSGQTYKLLSDKTSGLSAGSIAAGVNFKLSKKLTTDLSYSHSFYPTYSPLLQASNSENATVLLSYKSWMTASITGDYAFGKTNDAFVTAAVAKRVDLFRISKKDIVTISPSADIVGRTQHFYQSYIKEKKLRDSVLSFLPVPIFGETGSNHADTAVTTAFNVLSFNFKLPLAYNRGNYLLEAAYQLSLLSDQVSTSMGKVNSFLTFSFYYQF